jgi:hypothetical protein
VVKAIRRNKQEIRGVGRRTRMKFGMQIAECGIHN